MYFEMGLLKNLQGSQGIFGRLLVIHLHLLCCLGWLLSFASAQFDISEGVTGCINNFPTLGIICIVNLAIFVTSLMIGRLDLEVGAQDILDILASRKLMNINGINYTWKWTHYMYTRSYRARFYTKRNCFHSRRSRDDFYRAVRHTVHFYTKRNLTRSIDDFY